MITRTSKKIIKELEDAGLELNYEQRNIIHKNVYEATTESYNEGKNEQPIYYEDNGCNCGQPSCTFGCA